MKKLLLISALMLSTSVFAVEKNEINQAEIKYESLLKSGMSPVQSITKMAKDGISTDILLNLIEIKKIRGQGEKAEEENLFHTGPGKHGNNSVSPS